METEILTLTGPAGRLEAVLGEPPGAPRRTAVIAHPHPLYGGTMRNPVVTEVTRRLQAWGAATLCFNFRGVGASQGKHDGGPGEAQDLEAAVTELHRRHPGLPLVVAGYSFGARVALERLNSAHSRPAAGVLAIAPPLALYDFSFMTKSTVPVALVCGEQDDLTPAADVAALEEDWPGLVAVERVPGVAHDLGTGGWGGDSGLRRALDRALASLEKNC